MAKKTDRGTARSGATGGPLVAMVMGSESDWPTMQAAAHVLEEFGVPYEARIISAHRTPAAAERFASGAAGRGLRVLIAAAGGAAHLAGVLAAYTPLPVVAVPIQSGALQGLDSLLSTVQMPGGVPVATVSIDGAKNAALLAIQILGVGDPARREQMTAYKEAMRGAIEAKDAAFQKKRAASRSA